MRAASRRSALVVGAFSLLWAVGCSNARAEETVQLNPRKRELLDALKAEAKFGPEIYYTGAEPPDRAEANIIINDLIGELADRSAPITRSYVKDRLEHAIAALDLFETEDRERGYRYMVQIWHILGFEGPTGLFAHEGPNGFDFPGSERR